MMADMDEQALADIANGLYAAPLEDFIALRAAAVKEAAGQDKALVAAVKALPKPSVAAWAVNMLAIHEPEVLARLADLGGRMREAQASLDARALRELGRERRTELAAAVDTARSVVEEQGRPISDTIAGDVEEILRALTADEGAAAAVRSGRLLKTLSADGVSAADLEGAVAVPGALPAPAPASAPPARRPVLAPVPEPAPEKKRRTTPERVPQPKATRPRLEAVRQTPRPSSPPALEKAKAALAEAREEEARTSRLAQELQDQADETQSEIDALITETADLRSRLKAAEEQLDRSRKKLASTSAEAKQAARAADKAARTAMLAQERVLRLDN